MSGTQKELTKEPRYCNQYISFAFSSLFFFWGGGIREWEGGE